MSVQPRARDAARSREAILAAAENLFARHGFEGTTLAAIGVAAGLSRQAPAYFFGDKERLYCAVLERVFDARQERLGAGAAEARERIANGDVRAGLALIVHDYVAFLAERPTFVRLMGWEALGSGGRPEASPHASTALQESVDAVVNALSVPRRERDQLLLDIVALCFFPFAHAETMLARMGVEPDDRFLRARTDHVVELLTCWLTSYD